MSQRKPGKLKANNIFINLDAMKPGAVNPFLQKRRQTVPLPLSNHRTDEHELKQHPDPNLISPKLNQVTITTKRRKPSRKSSKSLLNKTNHDDAISYFGTSLLNKPSNPVATDIDLIPKTPPTPPPPIDLSPTHSQSDSLSLIDVIPTPFDDEREIDISTPNPPASPASPPPPPPNHIAIKANGCFQVLSVPPAPPPPVLTSIDKAPRDTAASTTFKVSGQKITVIGHARTGKTSLKNALFGRQFEDMTFPTVKAPLKPTLVVKPFNFGNDMNVEYEVWDTPGQKLLEYIPPLYITGSFCVLVVYDITDVYSYERAQYWIQYLEDNAKGYDNVVLIGNKYDLQERQRCVCNDAVQYYAEEHAIFFIEISVKTKHNFDVLLAWLNSKTQEKFVREMQMDEDALVYEDWDSNEPKGREYDGCKDGKYAKKQRKKEWIKRHQRHHRPIELDKIDVHSRNKKRNGCCLW
eukprot:31651_1